MQPLQETEAERGLLTVIVILSLGSLFVAFLGQHVLDIRPCILCIYQRIPYVVTALIAGAAAALPISSGSRRLDVALCGVVFAAGATLGVSKNTGGRRRRAAKAPCPRCSASMRSAASPQWHRR